MSRLRTMAILGWRKLRALLTGGIQQRITRLGLVFSFAVMVVGAMAFVSANNLMFLVLALLISAFLVSGFVSRLGIEGLELAFQLPEHVPARRPVPGRVRVRNKKRWMPSFSIHLAGVDTNIFPTVVYFPVIPAQEGIEETIAAMFPKRGSYRKNAFQFMTRFPFGFTERRLKVNLQGEVLVYPSIDPRAEIAQILQGFEGELAARSRGRGEDFHRIRPYEPGETTRHVDWKATAHTGNLQVREYAREEDPRVEIFLDLHPAPDPRFDAWFEEAVECCACLAWSLTRQDARVRLCTETAAFNCPEEVDIYTILKFLALVAPLPSPPAGSSVASGRAVFSDESSVLQIALSARPPELVTADSRVRVLGWELLAGADSRTGSDRAGADRNHGGGEPQDRSASSGDRAGTARAAGHAWRQSG